MIASLAGVLLLTALFCSLGFASFPVSVGVKVGDWVRYSITVDWERENLTLPLPVQFLPFQLFLRLSSSTAEVTSIAGSTVTIREHYRLDDGTEIGKRSFYGDVFSRDHNISSLVAPRGLSKGDQVPALGVAVADLVNRSYSGVLRRAIYVNSTFQSVDGSSLAEDYFDSSTGFRLESHRITTYGKPARNRLETRLVAVDSSIWRPETPSIFLIYLGASGAAASVAVGILYWVKRASGKSGRISSCILLRLT